MTTFVKSLAADEDGATAIEYGLIASLISVAIITAVSLLGTDVTSMFYVIAIKVAAVSPSS
jgi:pilus assembly protein Flp/PilA